MYQWLYLYCFIMQTVIQFSDVLLALILTALNRYISYFTNYSTEYVIQYMVLTITVSEHAHGFKHLHNYY